MVDAASISFIDLHNKTQEEFNSLRKEGSCTWRTWIRCQLNDFSSKDKTRFEPDDAINS